jgi:hypothetical protein
MALCLSLLPGEHQANLGSVAVAAPVSVFEERRVLLESGKKPQHDLVALILLLVQITI